MKFTVTRHGPGGIDYIEVEAETGDDAAAKAYKAGTVIRGIHPSEVQEAPAKKGKAD